jgi:hypothetical protein
LSAAAVIDSCGHDEDEDEDESYDEMDSASMSNLVLEKV